MHVAALQGQDLMARGTRRAQRRCMWSRQGSHLLRGRVRLRLRLRRRSSLLR